MRTPPRLFTALLGATLPVATLALAPSAAAVSPDIVISQVYGGGGNSGGQFRNDFIELFNRGSAPVDVTGFSVQYASSTGATFQVTPLSGTIPAGGYYLVQEAAGANTTAPALPTPDATGTIAMSATTGKVALASNTVAVACGSGTTCSDPDVRDFVGYGTANQFEGTGAAPTLSNSTADFRAASGCTDTDGNSTDFATGAPAPRNSASPAAPCSGPPPAPTFSIADVTVTEGDTASTATFTVTRTSGTGAAMVTAATAADGTATAGSDFTTTTATLTFAEGATTATFDVPVTGDDVPEADETFTVNLSNPSTGTISDGSAIGTITDDDEAPPVAGPVRIRDIQGAQHRSPLLGDTVDDVVGVVTARAGNGFYIQDDAPDTDVATSEGIFVFTSSAPPAAAAVGNRVFVDGIVEEFRPGGESGTNLSITQIRASVAGITASGTGVIEATVLGAAGRTPPTQVIEDDTNGSVEDPADNDFDPATDGIDFYESLEGMLVTVDNPVAVDASGPGGFGEIPVLADLGAGATGRTMRGGIEIDADDFNPERILLDDTIAPTPSADVGDTLSDATGVVGYSFGNFKVFVTATPTVTDGGLNRESTTAQGPGQLSVATFNVENLDPGDGAAKFSALAAVICDNLAAPDLLSLEEVQDNNGPTNDSTVDAQGTADTLIAAIRAECMIGYDYAEVDPLDDTNGGEPGGNIRVGFLFRQDRGLDFVERPGAGSTTANAVQDGPSGAQLQFSPGLIDPSNPAFDSSRKPLAGEFTYNGETLFVIGNHFNSKGGDQPLFGRFQPPQRSSEVQRRQQAAIVNGFVDQILAEDADANVVVLGDLNDFEFSEVLGIVAGDELTNLTASVPDDDRYTFIFEGNSQVLDHILVSDALLPQAGIDIVHSNIEFADGVSDHDPQVARLSLAGPALSVSDGSAIEGDTGTTPVAFRVTLSEPTSSPVTVDFSTSPVTATSPGDFVSETGGVTIPAGSITAAFDVAVNGDDVSEGDETFTVTLANPTGATIADGAGTGTITDDDGAPAITIDDVTVGEGDDSTTPATFTLRLSNPSTTPATVRATTGNFTAQAPSDYTTANEVVTFAPGQTTATFTVPVVGDGVPEAREAFVVRLSEPVGATVAVNEQGAADQGVGFINDDDVRASVSDAAVTEGTGGTREITFTVTLDRPAVNEENVVYNTTEGSAVEPEDFVSEAGNLVFAPDQTTQTFNITVNSDNVDEVNEVFNANLVQAFSSATVADGQGAGTIVDDDNAPSITITDGSVAEGNSGIRNLTFPVRLNRPSSRTVTVRFTSANGSAMAGSDYNTVSGTVTFAPGQTSRTVSVPVRGDTAREPNETLAVNLFSSAGAGIADPVGTGVIRNDD